MNKDIRKKANDTVVKSMERKYGMDLEYRTDAQLKAALKKQGVPSLFTLLKMVHGG